MGMYRFGKIVLARDFMLLAFLLKNADALTAMSKGILQWGLDKIGRYQRQSDKVFYLGYKAHSKKDVDKNKGSDIPVWLKGREDQKPFIFIGTFGVSYELELVLEAAGRFDKSGRDNICFVLAGTGEKSDMINRKIAKLQNVILPVNAFCTHNIQRYNFPVLPVFYTSLAVVAFCMFMFISKKFKFFTFIRDNFNEYISKSKSL